MGKIAVIDSGIGGLTVAKEIMKCLPSEEIVYFADQKNCPYGEKTKEEIQQYVYDIADFLQTMEIKALVIACNTATSVVLPEINGRYPFPIVGVIDPGAKLALELSKSKRIGVIATKKTIETGAYENVIQKMDKEASVYSMACPKLVPLLEGKLPQPELLHLALEEYLFPIKGANVDTLVLGCTHYPIIAPHIQAIMGEDILLANPATQTVKELAHILKEKNIAAFSKTNGEHLFYTSGDTTRFDCQIKAVLGLQVQSIKEETIFSMSK